MASEPTPGLSKQLCSALAVTITSRAFSKLIADRLRPLLVDVDDEFRMVLTVSLRGRNVRVQIGPEPYSDPGFKESSR